MSQSAEQRVGRTKNQQRRKLLDAVDTALWNFADEADQRSVGYEWPKDHGSAEWVQRVRRINAALTDALWKIEHFDAHGTMP